MSPFFLYISFRLLSFISGAFIQFSFHSCLPNGHSNARFLRFHFYHFKHISFSSLLLAPKTVKAHFVLSLIGYNFKLKEEHTKYKWQMKRKRQRNGKAPTNHRMLTACNIFARSSSLSLSLSLMHTHNFFK